MGGLRGLPRRPLRRVPPVLQHHAQDAVDAEPGCQRRASTNSAGQFARAWSLSLVLSVGFGVHPTQKHGAWTTWTIYSTAHLVGNDHSLAGIRSARRVPRTRDGYERAG